MMIKLPQNKKPTSYEIGFCRSAEKKTQNINYLSRLRLRSFSVK